MIENYFEKCLIFEMRKEKNNKMTPNLKFLGNQTQILENFKGKHKEDTKLRTSKDQERTKNMQIRKIKRKQRHAIDTKLKI